jgi:hypothetical protein
VSPRTKPSQYASFSSFGVSQKYGRLAGEEVRAGHGAWEDGGDFCIDKPLRLL